MVNTEKRIDNNIKNIVIASLGQLIHSDYKKSFTAFAGIFREHDFYFPELRVIAAYCLDLLWYNTINSYKCGDIKFEEFHKRLCNQLGIQISEEKFRKSWNAMCEVNEKTVGNLRDVIDLQRASPFVLLIVSFTNQCQYDHILNSLKERGLDITKTPNIAIKASFEVGECSLNKLAGLSMLYLDGYEANKTVISLTNQITSGEKIGINKAHFKYHKSNSKGNSLVEIIKNAITAKQASHIDRLNTQKTHSNTLCIGR